MINSEMEMVLHRPGPGHLWLITTWEHVAELLHPENVRNVRTQCPHAEVDKQ